MMRLGVSLGVVEERLDQGLVVCPLCGGRMARWGWDRPRPVRFDAGDRDLRRMARRRRLRCSACGVTSVVQDASMVTRRRDGLAVLREAFGLFRAGWGFHRVADRLDRPFSTVRNWLRAFKAGAAWVGEVLACGFVGQHGLALAGGPGAAQAVV
jgi:transposase-like protein